VRAKSMILRTIPAVKKNRPRAMYINGAPVKGKFEYIKASTHFS